MRPLVPAKRFQRSGRRPSGNRALARAGQKTRGARRLGNELGKYQAAGLLYLKVLSFPYKLFVSLAAHSVRKLPGRREGVPSVNRCPQHGHGTQTTASLRPHGLRVVSPKKAVSPP